MVRLLALGGLMGVAAFASTGARAQTDLSAGMSPAQLFAENCAACHQSPRGLGRGRDPARIAYFLRDHYTTRPGIAAALAGYLAGNRGPEPRQAPPPPPSVGGRTAPAAAPAASPAARPRPLERLANPTVDRLKSFASDADPAKPSAPDAPERGAARVQSYSASGAAADTLRDAAVATAIQEGRFGTTEQGGRSSRGNPPGTPNSDAGTAARDSGGSAGAGAAPASGAPSAAPPQGPPPTSATPSAQSNTDKP